LGLSSFRHARFRSGAGAADAASAWAIHSATARPIVSDDLLQKCAPREIDKTQLFRDAANRSAKSGATNAPGVAANNSFG